MTEKTSYYLREVLDITNDIKKIYTDLAQKDKVYNNYIRQSYYNLLKKLYELKFKEDELYESLNFNQENLHRIILELKETYRKSKELIILRIINKLKEKECLYYPSKKNQYLLELQLDIDLKISNSLEMLLQNCNNSYYPEIKDKKYELIMLNPLLENILLRKSLTNKSKLKNEFLDIPMADLSTNLENLEKIKLNYIKNILIEYLNTNLEYYTSSDVTKKVISIIYLKAFLIPLNTADINNLCQNLPNLLKFIYLRKGVITYNDSIVLMNTVIKEALKEQKNSPYIKLILKN